MIRVWHFSLYYTLRSVNVLCTKEIFFIVHVYIHTHTYVGMWKEIHTCVNQHICIYLKYQTRLIWLVFIFVCDDTNFRNYFIYIFIELVTHSDIHLFSHAERAYVRFFCLMLFMNVFFNIFMYVWFEKKNGFVK